MRRKSDTLNQVARIAAMAKMHELTIATRNVGEFKAFGIQTFNSFTPEQV
jgi:predicted nucleic acid-binding protein